MNLLRGNPLGIEITDTHVKLCELRKGGKAQVKHYAMVELPEGTMNDGRIQDESALTKTIRQALDSYPWATNNVRFAIPSQTVMVRFLKMPNVKDKALRKLVDFEIKHNIHLPFDDPHYDFVKLEAKGKAVSNRVSEEQAFQSRWEAAAAKETLSANPFEDKSADSENMNADLCDVMLVAASRETLNQYISLFGDLGLQFSSIEIKAFSLNRLYQKIQIAPQQELQLLADISATNCDLTIVQNGIIRITRNVPISFFAQKSAQTQDALDAMFADFLPQKENYDASFADLSSEIERLMNFYRYTLNHRDAEFERILITGDVPMMDELVAYLRNRMTFIVDTVHWPSLEAAKGKQIWDLSVYAVPLGLCLRRGS